ncbi:hypothetical protein M0R45_003717 [Rubus argutus]|uniref:Uncharacterized protein n=1 Tax=Rubus argutus TaxID=59490 RepID=A0AAW1YG97_RUBAR
MHMRSIRWNWHAKVAPFRQSNSLALENLKALVDHLRKALVMAQMRCPSLKRNVLERVMLIDVSESKFGSTSCGDIVKRLAVEAVC